MILPALFFLHSGYHGVMVIDTRVQPDDDDEHCDNKNLIPTDLTKGIFPITNYSRRTSWGSQLEAFEDTLAHEKKVTAMINNLYDMAVTEKDHATASMLKWFIDEQVEEEESATTIIDSLKLVSGDKMGVFMLDKELATRTYTQAAPLAGKE